jgi:ComF family protein
MGVTGGVMEKAAASGVIAETLSRLVGIVYPPTCMGCGILVRRPGGLCAKCWSGLRHIEPPVCPVLGIPFGHQVEEGTLSLAAMAKPPAFTRARAAVLYDEVAKLLVHRLKYNDRAELALPMAGWMMRAAGEFIADCDRVIAVPLHRRRLLTRRYNQSAELARALARLSGKPLDAESLVRRRATLQQVGLGQKARERNVRGAFSVPEARRGEILGARIALIDDVYTTGATVNAAARALLRAGAADVSVVTFARVEEPDRIG